MADISFSLADLFEKTFGYKTQAFNPEFLQVQGDKAPFRSEQGVYGSPFYASDALGIEYYMPVTISYPGNGQQTQPNSGSGNAQGALKKWNLPYPIVSITSQKTVI